MTPDVMLLDVLSERDARAVARWRYPPPYDCYDAPPWSRMPVVATPTARRTTLRLPAMASGC